MEAKNNGARENKANVPFVGNLTFVTEVPSLLLFTDTGTSSASMSAGSPRDAGILSEFLRRVHVLVLLHVLSSKLASSVGSCSY
jgi:hypothetical protein